MTFRLTSDQGGRTKHAFEKILEEGEKATGTRGCRLEGTLRPLARSGWTSTPSLRSNTSRHFHCFDF